MKKDCCDGDCRQGRDCPNRVGGEEVILKVLLILAVILSGLVVFNSVVRAL